MLVILFTNPNFLILDEPTNDLDLPTLGVLENFLSEFQGCVLIVSHDRYFMDRLVDHLFVFEGEGDVRDFPGNYSLYREWIKANEKKDGSKWDQLEQKKNSGETTTAIATDQPTSVKAVAKPAKKATYNEKREFENLEKEMQQLEKEKKQLEESLATLPFEEIEKASIRIGAIATLLTDKEMRWLELSEIV